MHTVVVTGASGYIGGQISLQLVDAGYHVVGIDRRPCPQHLSRVYYRFITDNFASNYALDHIKRSDPVAVIHCAGTSLVGPSIENPEMYYHNNVANTLLLLSHMRNLPKTRLIFSSSAATYGNPVSCPISEQDPTVPVSPYGESKLVIDWMLNSYHRAYNLDYVSFRYFNACGADSQARHGQEPYATHIIARVLESIRDDQEFRLYGNNYATPDGTCIRDYVHVEDIANAHILALDPSVKPGVYNLGSGQGISNLEIITRSQAITDKALVMSIGERRIGDPDILTADYSKFNLASAWEPKYNLDDILKHAWAWYTK